MRFFQNSCFAIVMASIATMPVVANANSEKATRLAKIEAAGLASAGNKRLASLVQASASSAGSVVFSNSWLEAQPKASGSEEWRCLSEALYFEARGETVKGQFAVAEVIINRVKSPRFPGSLCGVINQGTGHKYRCQFTYTCDGRDEVVNDPATYARVAKVARASMDGKAAPLTDGATYYHTTAVKPNWSRVFTKTARIGVHLFYRPGTRTASN